jgi:hypothetical protein
MKTPLFIFAAIFMLSYFQLTKSDNLKSHPIDPYAGFEKIRADINKQIALLTPMDKLNLAMVDYMFKYPDKYQKLLTIPDEQIKTALSKDNDFLSLCKKYKVTLNDIDTELQFNKNLKNK